MSYQIQLTDTFSKELQTTPKRVSKKVTESYRTLRERPKGPNTHIKKLKRYKSLYRYRIADHRFVYQVKDDENNVTLIQLGPREGFYEKIGYDPSSDAPTARIIADVDMHQLLEHPPTSEEIQIAQVETANFDDRETYTGIPETPLPRMLTLDLLRDLEIPTNQFGPLVHCQTESDLLALSDKSEISNDTLNTILESLYPTPIEESIQDAKRIITSENDLVELAEGERSLDSFLLALDEDQKPLTERFRADSPVGPWIVKGGPGSGKSTVALYCIKNILHEDNQTLQMSADPLKVLFVTYTRTLVKFSQYLLKALGVNHARQQVDVINVDKLVTTYLPSNWNKSPISSFNETRVHAAFADAIQACNRSIPNFQFSINDSDFLLKEIEMIIIGNEISEEEAYLGENRKGRGRPLNQNQRKQLWTFYTEIQQRLDSAKLCLWQDRILRAKQNANSMESLHAYDFVFIDEAQDLTPIAIKFCVALACDPKNVFLTADRNQSIYGSNFSWRRVSDSLNFRGRSTIFRKNYRTTMEIIEAVRPLLDVDSDQDKETLLDEPVKLGPQPQLKLVSSPEEEISALTNWLDQVRISERIGFESTAILCPRKTHCEFIAEALPSKFNGRFFNRDSEEFRHNGTTIMTMHSSKGLQYPAVAVVGLTEGQMPWPARGGEDPGETNRILRRLFYVACTRSMSQLLVIGGKNNPSSFIQELDLDYWES